MYIINHWYLNDKSFQLRSHRKGYSPILSYSRLPPYYHLLLAPLSLIFEDIGAKEVTIIIIIIIILIIMSSFILIMFGERIEAHGFANTITVWRARQSCRMSATCLTAASFPDARYITWHVMEMQHMLADGSVSRCSSMSS